MRKIGSNKPWLIGGAALGVLLALILARLALGEPVAPDAAASTAKPTERAVTPLAPLPARATKSIASLPLFEFSADDEVFLAELRARFAPHIHVKHSQIKAIEQVVAYLMQRYPEDWRDRVAAFLQALFPDLAAELLTKFEGLMHYNDWLREQRQALMRLSPGERRAALWAAREQAFGADAPEIWAAELRNEKVHASLEAIEVASGAGFTEKLDIYLDAIHEAYGDKAEAFIDRRQTELMNNFLSVDTVQEDLQALPAARRNAELRQLRQRLGMEAPALERWDALDARRDRAWEAGQQYMREREQIVAAHAGAEQIERIEQLRQRVFGEEAATIASEEAAGFYRFAGSRRIGRE